MQRKWHNSSSGNSIKLKQLISVLLTHFHLIKNHKKILNMEICIYLFAEKHIQRERMKHTHTSSQQPCYGHVYTYEGKEIINDDSVYFFLRIYQQIM